MPLLTSVSAGLRVQAAIKLHRLLEMPEMDFERQIRQVEATDGFRLLREAGVVAVCPYPRTLFAARRASLALGTSNSDLEMLLDGHGRLARLIEGMGQDRFEQVFLQDTPLSDEERARLCGIACGDAQKLRELVDRLYVQAGFEGASGCASSAAPPAAVYSAVAGVEIEGGRPVIAFFHRDVWKGRYEIDRDKWPRLAQALPASRSRDLERLLAKLEFMERRKTTLYRILETLLDLQADYLVTGDFSRRVQLTQKRVAMRLEISPCVLNVLVSNKSIRLPWGLEAPIKALMPSSKALLLDRVHDLAVSHPRMSDLELGLELRRVCGARLSRRSVAQYRSDLGLGGRGHRCAEPAAA